MADALARRLSLRARLVLIATLVVTVVLLMGGALLGLALRGALIDDLEDAARLRAHELATLASQGSLPRPVPIEDAEEALVQVVVGDRVVTSSENVSDLPPLRAARPAPGETSVDRLETLPVQDDEAGFVLAAASATGPDGTVTVFVASSTEDVDEVLGEAGALALLVLPVLVLLLSAVTWAVVGRTLSPVERIRAEAAAISSRSLYRRVSEPEQQDEIGRLARTLNQMLGRLDESAERQRRFVADAAHELRTPISSVRAQLEIARASSRSIDWEEIAEDVLAEMVRLQRLTEQLLLLAAADAGRLTVQRRAVDLDDVVHAVVSEYDHDRPIDVDTSRVRPAQVTGDAVLLEQLVRNLVENARRHANARVALVLRRGDGVAELTVDDDGAGISAEQRGAVFERFIRLDEARSRHQGGTGLGLAIVSDIVRAHEGEVHASESPLGGARFRVALPLADQAEGFASVDGDRA